MKTIRKLLLLPLLLALAFLDNYQAAAQTRLGLHFTAEEVTVWQDRWANGPFKVANDATGFPVSVNNVNGGNGLKNTPGDRTRILANATAFRTNPNPDYYNNSYKGSGMVPAMAPGIDPVVAGVQLRDAGFTYLMTGDASYAAVVRTQLLRYAADPLIDFTNRVKYPLHSSMGELNPSFIIGEMLTRVMYGMEYINAYSSFTSGEKIIVNAWLYGGAVWLESLYNGDVSSYFTNRLTTAVGPYTMTGNIANQEKNLSDHSIMHLKADGSTGYKAGKVTRTWGNKRTTQAGTVGLIGIHLGNQNLQVSAKKFFKDFFIYAVWPDGTYCDEVRQGATNPEKGFDYCHISMLFAFADAGARIGDTELYDYTTLAGTTTAQSGVDATTNGTTPKGIKMFAKHYADMRNHQQSPKYYGTKVTANAGVAAYEMDGIGANGYTVLDLLFVNASKYYYVRDGYTYFRDTYTRNATGAVPLPANAQAAGANPPWGTGGFYPGTLFMFGKTEGVTNPYPTLQGTTPKTNQTITLNAIPTKTYGDAAFGVTVSASSGLSVTLTSLATGVFTVSGTTITIVGAGAGTLRASQAGNGTYNAAGNADITITVNKKIQTLTFNPLVDKQTTASAFSVSATSSEGLTPTYSITSGPATISGSTITLNAVIGTVTVTASQAGNANIAAATSIPRSFNVIAVPVVSITDVIPAATFSDRDTTIVINGGRHMKYIRTYTLATSYTTASKTSVESGDGDDGNGLANVSIRILAGSTWVTLPVNNSGWSAFLDADLTYSGTAYTKVELSTIGANIKNRLNRFQFKGTP